MIRAIGIFGFAGAFTAISPNLREALGEALVSAVDFLQANSPYSYVVAGAAALGIMALLARSATALR